MNGMSERVRAIIFNLQENEKTMGPKDVIRKTLDMSDFILKKYVEDLSDADLGWCRSRACTRSRCSSGT